MMRNLYDIALIKKLVILALIVLVCTTSVSFAEEETVLFIGYNDERLYIRDKPSRSTGERVGAYEAYSLIEVLEDLGDWYRVQDGFVMSRYVYMLENSPFESLILGSYNYTKNDMKKDNMPMLKIKYLAYLETKTSGEAVTKKGKLNFVGYIPVYDIIDGYCYFPSGREIYRIKASAFSSFEEIGDNCRIVAAYRTVYFSSKDNRKFNIGLVSQIINGTIVRSGATFSYNKTTGPRGKKQGYKLAGVISGGKVIEDYGGGVCQVSSTIYATIMNNSHFKVVSRKPHGLEVTYLPVGMDATVSYDSTDFKFTNNYNFDVMINIYAENGVCLVTITRVE